MNQASRLPILLALLAPCCCLPVLSTNADPAADRSAVEKVYYAHRLNSTQPFEEAVPRSTIERLVARDRHKEEVLASVYHIRISDDAVASEVARIESSTRAPEILTELKAALGNDPQRFADTVARPIVVERRLRACFQNDAKLHLPRREQIEETREQLLAAKNDGLPPDKLSGLLESSSLAKENHETGSTHTPVTWTLTPKPASAQANETPVQHSTPPPETTVTAAAGPYSFEATARVAQVLSSPDQDSQRDDKHYFEDLNPRLRQVLDAQLIRPGAISAVFETPNGFLLYLATARSDAELTVQSLSLPKVSYDQWLEDLKETIKEGKHKS